VGTGLSGVRAAGTLALPGLALLLLGAHFFRAGLVPVAAACAVLLALLFVRAPWSARMLQAALALGTLEWLRTAWVFASARAAAGQPYTRLLVILGGVALVTALAAWLLRTRAARAHFRVPD
jgi:hypothetical protein